MDLKKDCEGKIYGGYVITPRLWDEHVISSAPGHTREIFSLFMRQANHTDVIRGGTTFKRGNLLTTYEQIIDRLKWSVGFRQESYSRTQVESSLKWLVKHGLITKSKTTRGLIITICNYDHWQTPSNYEHQTECHTKTTSKPQCAATINKNDKNEKNERNYLVPEINISYDQFDKLYGVIGDKHLLSEIWASFSNQERNEIMIYIPKYLSTIPKGKFKKDAERFLLEKRWKNESADDPLKKPITMDELRKRHKTNI